MPPTATQPKFEIRRLEIGEMTNPETDFYIHADQVLPINESWAIKEYSFPHYRITAKPAEAEQPGEGSVSPLPASRFEGRQMHRDEIIQAADWCVDVEGDTHRPCKKDIGVSVSDALNPQSCVREYRTHRPAPASVESAPAVDIVRHEVEELRKAVESMRKQLERKEHEVTLAKQTTTLAVESLSKIATQRNEIQAERDKLRNELDAMQENVVRMMGENTDLQAQLAAKS